MKAIKIAGCMNPTVWHIQHHIQNTNMIIYKIMIKPMLKSPYTYNFFENVE